MKKNKSHVNLFSLVELVIIVSVLAVICTITVGAAKKRLLNKSDICKNHLRKICMAQTMYAADNNQRLAIKLHQLNSYLGYKKYDIPAVTGCPAVPKSLRRQRWYANGYGKNAYVFVERKKFAKGGNPKEIKNKFSCYKQQDKTMMYMDFPPEPKGGSGTIWASEKWIKNGDKTAFRHKGRANCLYFDGHVKALAPKFKAARIFWGY